MPEEKIKTPRLGQAAKEFNVSNDRIIAILAKNGLEINAPTPNSKLSVEMYQCLQKELAKDKLVKEKSEQILPSKNKKEESKPDSPEKGREEEPDGHHIIIHTTKLVDAPTVESPEVHGPEVKIIGSISPDSLTKTSKKNTSGITKEDSSEKQKDEAPLMDTPANPKEETTSETQEESLENPVQESVDTQQEGEKTEHIETVAHISGPAIIGTMDLESLKPKKKATSKEKKVQKKEKPAKVESQEKDSKIEEEVQQEPTVTPAPVQEAPEHIKTVVNPLKGPKILGTIDLSLLQNNKEGGKKEEHRNGDNQDKKKKKRKRVAKPVKAANIPNGKDDKEKRQKQEPEKVEISAEDIHRRIKETKMRLESNTKRPPRLPKEEKKNVSSFMSVLKNKSFKQLTIRRPCA